MCLQSPARRQTGIDTKTILYSTREKASHAGGFIWRYDTNVPKLDSEILAKYPKPIKIPVNQYDVNGCLVDSYRTVRKATLSMKYSDQEYRILVRLLWDGNGVAPFKGYTWKYATL